MVNFFSTMISFKFILSDGATCLLQHILHLFLIKKRNIYSQTVLKINRLSFFFGDKKIILFIATKYINSPRHISVLSLHDSLILIKLIGKDSQL